MTRSPASDPLVDTLTLADWRRTVSTLYADVRRMASTDPGAALAHWRAVRETLFRTHPQSPVPTDRRATFVAHHFAHDPALRFEVPVDPTSTDHVGAAGLGVPGGLAALALSGSEPATMAFRRLGSVGIPFVEGTRRLEVFWMEGYAGGLFLPFRDATNGSETYGAGRYLLDGAKSADLGGDPHLGTLILDFNFAFHPSCAWDPRYACPLSPPSNRLDVAIRAGERLT